MSSSTALLPKNNKKDDHPIFLRVCHSPWVGIGQNVLVSLRGFVAVYLSVVFLMIMDYEIKRLHHGWMVPFELQNISYLFQVIYAWITFTWTFMHFNYPHHGSQAPSPSTSLQKFLSPPKQHSSSGNRTFFSIFYTAVISYPHVVTLVYWLILLPHQQNDGTIANHLFGHGWFRPFIILNQYAGNSALVLLEIIFLSSIKRQEPIWAHTFGLTALSLIYIGWAYLGKFFTGRYVYYFLDQHQIGWEYVTVAIVAFCALGNIFFVVNYGVTGVREMLTKKSEDKSQGYVRLPQ